MPHLTTLKYLLNILLKRNSQSGKIVYDSKTKTWITSVLVSTFFLQISGRASKYHCHCLNSKSPRSHKLVNKVSPKPIYPKYATHRMGIHVFCSIRPFTNGKGEGLNSKLKIVISWPENVLYKVSSRTVHPGKFFINQLST